MKRNGFRLATIVLGTLFMGLPSSTSRAVVVYDLAADWSDTNNPNGAWSYFAAIGVPLTNHFDDYDPGRFAWTSAQPAWAYATYPQQGHIPLFYKAVATRTDPRDDQPLGRVYMHNNDPFTSPPGLEFAVAGVAWTAPEAGEIAISGAMWQVQRYLGRSEDWALTLNGTLLTDGTLTFANATSDTPLDFATGSGGALALVQSVQAGDVLRFELTRSAGEPFGTNIGLDMTVQFTPIPEPTSLALCGLGLLGALAGFGRRRAPCRG